MKRLMLILFCMVLLLGSVNALEIDNWVTYEDNDMRAIIENAFSFGKLLGTAELTSHKSVDQVLQVFPGHNVPVIIYDTNFTEGNSLGDVQWINMKTGKKEERDYYYAKAIYEDKLKPVNEFGCNTITENGTSWQECGNIKTGEELRNEFVRWEKITETNIPNGTQEIAVITDVNQGDYYDTIVTFAGKKLSRHVEWNSSQEIGLIAYYDFDEELGTTILDEFFGNASLDGTLIGGGQDTDWVTGLIGNAFNFTTNTTGSFFNMTFDMNTTNGSINLWINPRNIVDGNPFFGRDSGGIINGNFILFENAGVIRWRIDSGGASVSLDADSTIQDDVYSMITITWNATGYQMYINATLQSSAILATQAPLSFAGCWGIGISIGTNACPTLAAVNNITIDEFSFYDIELSSSQVTTLYDNGTGMSPGETALGRPTITLNSPINNFNTTNLTIDFNGTVTSPNGVTNVTLFIDGILNETNSSGINDTNYLFTKIISVANHNWTYESCNSIGCRIATTRNFTILNFVTNNYTFNSSSFETAQESFIVNITTNGTTPTNARLIYNGTTFTGAAVTSLGNNNFNISRTITIPLGVGTTNFHFNFSLGEEFNTTTQNQIINLTNLTLCGSPQTTPFINLTFINETLAQESINSTIDSTWTYSLTALSGVNKTLTFSDATENLNYAFCATPNRSLNIQVDIDYDNSISQQRSFSLTTAISNVTLTQTLFLLPTSLGLFSPFKTTNINGDTIAFVSAVITRVLGGSTITVANGLTDSSGFATFFLNPNVAHSATFSKTGFADNVFVFTPTADLRTVTMGGGGVIANGTVITRGTVYTISPRQTTLPNNTVISFTFNVTSNLTTISLISMNITNSTNNQLLFVSNAGVGNLSGTLNTRNNTKLIGSYLIQTGEETITVTRTWTIFASFIGDYSLFRQLTLTVDNNLISDFNRLLIVLSIMFAIVIFMSVGQIIETSESKIAVLLLLTWAFSIVGWLDTGLAVSTASAGINRLGEFSNQFGIAILMTGASILFIFRRLFIRKPV